MKFSSENLVSGKDDDTAICHISGTLDTTINNWTGTLTYTAANTAPTYVMSNGSTEEDGTLQPKTSLRLSERGSKIKAGLKRMIRN